MTLIISLLSLLAIQVIQTAYATDISHHLALRTDAPVVTVTATADTSQTTPDKTVTKLLTEQSPISAPAALQTCADNTYKAFGCGPNVPCGFAASMPYMGCCNAVTTSGAFYVPQGCNFATRCVAGAAAASLGHAARADRAVLKCTASSAASCAAFVVAGGGFKGLQGYTGFVCDSAGLTQTVTASHVSTAMPVSATATASGGSSIAALAVALASADPGAATNAFTGLMTAPDAAPTTSAGSGAGASARPSSTSSAAGGRGRSFERKSWLVEALALLLMV